MINFVETVAKNKNKDILESIRTHKFKYLKTDIHWIETTRFYKCEVCGMYCDIYKHSKYISEATGNYSATFTLDISATLTLDLDDNGNFLSCDEYIMKRALE